MKTMMNLDGTRIIRVSDEEASRIYHEGGFRYITKSKWKEKVRTKAGDVGMELQDKQELVKNKSNKISKATKRHLRKNNK